MGPLQTYFYACATLAVVGAASVVIAKNPIHSVMGLLLLILNIAGLFLVLHAQFLAAVQLIVYAGAIVVLFLFVIMLLGPSATTSRDRRGVVVRAGSGALFTLAGFGSLWSVVHAWALSGRVLPMPNVDPGFGGIDAFGNVLFSDAIVPFELSSALLMIAVLGAIGVARGRQGLRSLPHSEREIARGALVAPEPLAAHLGVYSHEAPVKEESSA